MTTTDLDLHLGATRACLADIMRTAAAIGDADNFDRARIGIEHLDRALGSGPDAPNVMRFPRRPGRRER